jgi:HK97 family phage prohead protease
MLIRDFPAQIKAAGTADGLADGQFEAIVSVFGNVDTYGDRVLKGAFAEDVERWKSGEPLPVVWSHKWDDPFSHIGYGLDAKETDRGLWVKGQIEDLQENPTAAQVHRLLKSRRVTQFSFAYDVLDGGFVVEDVKGAEGDAPMKREVYELRKLKTHEVGPCLLGVNQETELIGAKAAGLASAVAAGRQLDAGSLKRLQQSVAALREVIVLSGGKTESEPEPNVDTSTGRPVDKPADSGTVEPVPADESQTGQSPADDDPSGDKSAQAAPVIARRVALVDTLFL